MKKQGLKMIQQKKIIHQFYCRDCDCAWYSKDVHSVCPICAKTIVAKIMIVREERQTEENN